MEPVYRVKRVGFCQSSGGGVVGDVLEDACQRFGQATGGIVNALITLAFSNWNAFVRAGTMPGHLRERLAAAVLTEISNVPLR